MGIYHINKVQIIRNYNPREIVVSWHDGILGFNIRKFTFEQSSEALKFASEKFSELSM